MRRRRKKMGIETLAYIEVKGNILHVNKNYLIFIQVSTVSNTCSKQRETDTRKHWGPR